MSILSVGYAGTITDANWRRMSVATIGALYGVDDFASWKVSTGVGDRVVTVAIGGGFGLGVRDVSDAPVNLSLATVATGSRWDLIVAHRDWDDKLTTFQVIQGSSVRALPARQAGFDSENDQPLALVRVTAGQTQVQEILDLRCVPGDGGLVAFHDLARSYLNRVGTSVRIGNLVWDRTVDSVGSPTWVSSSVIGVEHQTLGAIIPQIQVPPGSVSSANVLVKTGRITDYGQTFGFPNQYLSAVVFDTPFPNSILSVQLTQVHLAGGPQAAPIIALDDVKNTGFRIVYPGQNASTIRSALWAAYGN